MTRVAVAQNYARALYQLSQEKGIDDEVLSGLEFLENYLLQEHELKQVLSHPLIGKSQKKEIIQQILQLKENGIPDDLYYFLYVVIDKKRGNIIRNMVELYRHYYQEARNIQEVEVYSPLELKEHQKKMIAENMEKHIGRKVVLQEKVDPSMKGGVILKAGSQMLDGSLETRLKNMEEQLRQ